MTYKITQERLAALSPTARQLAEIAIAEGIWALVDEKCGEAPRAGGARVAKNSPERAREAQGIRCAEANHVLRGVMSRLASQGGEHSCKQIL